MEVKKTILIKVSYLVELSEDEIDLDNEHSTLEEITSKIGETKDMLVNGRNIELEWESTSSLILDPTELNCGRCANCGQWVTDREKPTEIKELCNGATIDGKLLCDECLPSDHRWAF